MSDCIHEFTALMPGGIAMHPDTSNPAVELEWRIESARNGRQLQVLRSDYGRTVVWIFAPQGGPGE